MAMAGDTIIDLGPPILNLPLMPLVRSWKEADFEAKACRASLEELIDRYAISDRWFRPDEVINGGFVATDEYLFHDENGASEWRWRIVSPKQKSHFSATVPLSAVQDVAHITRSLHRCETPGEFATEFGDNLNEEIVRVVGGALEQSPDFGRWPELTARGIYRREHASIAIRTATTCILFDPQGYSGAWTTGYGKYPADGQTRVDAVALTHGHGDHWHLPSILRHCDEKTRVIVPHVPRVNLLTPQNFAAALKASGQPHFSPRWYEKISVGDMEVEILPFFGEQPTRHEPGARDGLRNWGNCYSIRSADFSVLVLADSGSDPMGNVCDMVRDAVARGGSYDVVLSNCRSFPEAINPGLPTYAFAVPFERLREIRANQKRGHIEIITAGIEGVAEICAIAKARYFLPYAHGFNALDDHEGLEGPAATESDLMHALDVALRSRGAPTQISLWSIGDRFPIGDVVLPD